jgi:hypothetical protein
LRKVRGAIMTYTDELHPVGEQLSEAIWTAAHYAVNEIHCSKDQFVAMVTRAANEAFDSQANNAAVRLRRNDGPARPVDGR